MRIGITCMAILRILLLTSALPNRRKTRKHRLFEYLARTTVVDGGEAALTHTNFTNKGVSFCLRPSLV